MKTPVPEKLHYELVKEIKPVFRYEGQPVEAFTGQCREKLKELLGMNEFVPCEPTVTVTERSELNGCRRIHFTVETEKDYLAHCDLLLPPTQAGPLPLCVCLQGHASGAHRSLNLNKYPCDTSPASEGDRDFAIQAVARGYAALAVEQRGFGECGGTDRGPDCNPGTYKALLLGRTTIGERVWDVSRILDAMETNFADLVTLKGSLCMGNSGGGTATIYIACLEHRLDAFMPSCAMCTYLDSIVAMTHCSCNYIPGIAKYFDMGDLAMMMAPKKLVVVCGKDDPIFPLHGVKKSFELIQKCYAAHGAPENCRLVIGNEGHRFYAADAWPVLEELMK